MKKSEEILEKHIVLNDCIGYLGSDGRLYKAIIDALNEAINYTHSCTELKDKEAISFEDWVDFEGHRDYYNDLVGNGFAYDIEKFYKRYIEAVKPSL